METTRTTWPNTETELDAAISLIYLLLPTGDIDDKVDRLWHEANVVAYAARQQYIGNDLGEPTPLPEWWQRASVQAYDLFRHLFA